MLEKMVNAEKIRRSLAVGTVFPEFTETNLLGQRLAVRDFRGKIVLVDFWATWCVPCMLELPSVQRTYARYHGSGFKVIGISLDQDRDKLTAFLKEREIPWAQYNDGKFWDTKLVVQYGVEAIPATYLLDRNGKILAVNPRGAQLEELVADALQPALRRWLSASDRWLRKYLYSVADPDLRRGFYRGLAAATKAPGVRNVGQASRLPRG